ncbi:Hypothetical protein SMAX5B_014512 [Scophthalmus maximus]|uniref:Uncharacterized protein n=1 Tax=Scophthalmus maximus TaxID=52904 RepID=A0A2U9C3E7_SCOMX|nr:Hypothetical protein SMAX5B_014512 [Scophthalmus maximus]
MASLRRPAASWLTSTYHRPRGVTSAFSALPARERHCAVPAHSEAGKSCGRGGRHVANPDFHRTDMSMCLTTGREEPPERI